MNRDSVMQYDQSARTNTVWRPLVLLATILLDALTGEVALAALDPSGYRTLVCQATGLAACAVPFNGVTNVGGPSEFVYTGAGNIVGAAAAHGLRASAEVLPDGVQGFISVYAEVADVVAPGARVHQSKWRSIA